MSSNRLRYDTCTYKTDITQSSNTLNYMLDKSRYENCNQCRMELGIVGGNNVSHIRGNLVDLENDLRGQTRLLSNCPQRKYQFNKDSGVGGEATKDKKSIRVPKCKNGEINVELQHLPPCQIIRYEPVPLPPPMDLPECVMPVHKMQH